MNKMNKINIDEINIKLKNVIYLGCIENCNNIDLNLIPKKHVKKDIPKFKGMTINIKDFTVFLYKSGKFHIYSRNIESIESKKKALKTFLNKNKIKCNSINGKIINMMGMIEINKIIDLNRLSIILDDSIYDPCIFPAMFYQPLGKGSFSIFNNGKIMIMGFTSLNKMKDDVNSMLKAINMSNCFIEYDDDVFEETMIFV